MSLPDQIFVNNRLYIAATLAVKMPNGLRRGKGLNPLMARIALEMCEGHPSKVIAQRLGRSHRTVETYRAAIFKRRGVKNAIQLALQMYVSGEYKPSASSTRKPALA